MKRQNNQQSKKKKSNSSSDQSVTVVKQNTVRQRQPIVLTTPIPRINPRAIEAVCAVSDPFCRAASSGRYSGLGSLRTAVYNYHASFAFAVNNASGNSSVLFSPSFNTNSFLTATLTGTAASVAGVVYTDDPIKSNLTPTGARLVSYGIRLRSTTAPLYASGLVKIRLYSTSQPSTLSTYDISTFNCDDYLDVRLQDLSDTCIVLNRIGLQAKEFGTIGNKGALTGGTIFTYVSPGFQYCTVSVVGGPPSVVCLDFEVFENWELVFNDSSANMMFAAIQPPLPTLIQAAQDTVQNTVKGIFIGGVQAVGRFVIKAATNALAIAVSAKTGIPLSRMSALTVD